MFVDKDFLYVVYSYVTPGMLTMKNIGFQAVCADSNFIYNEDSVCKPNICK